ncbi:hypothetical protein EYR40_002202 [Pleurotus pulmonarius]|nr:hypothetical protein EYR36_002305 [Pleurotus pulmonarius]KAF4583711.1 hypothetical protein EYR40_002202 [Pleurotus pulmonarius]
MYFDKTATALQVEEEYRKLYDVTSDEDLCDMKDIGKLRDTITLECVDKRGSMMLSVQDDSNLQTTELVVRVVGALVGQDLPPRRRPV